MAIIIHDGNLNPREQLEVVNAATAAHHATKCDGRSCSSFLSNVSSAFANACVDAPALFNVIAEAAALTKLDSFKLRELANTAWATASVEAPAFINAVADASKSVNVIAGGSSSSDESC